MQHALFTHNLTLRHGDCVDVLARHPVQAQTIFIDPPYATGNKKAKYEHSRLLQEKRWTNFAADWDVWATQEAYAADVERWCEAIRGALDTNGTLWVCGSHHSIPTWDLTLKRMGFWINQWVSWCIPNAMPNVAMTQMASSNQTLIWARRSQKARHYYDKAAARSYNGGKNLRDYWIIPNDCTTGKLWKHPSKKPVPLVQRALHISTPHDALILDCFAGSGTTGVAARNLGRGCVLIEKEAEYIAMIEERLAVREEAA
jgi:DNA modification methylase